jgi:hypothetical protein
MRLKWRTIAVIGALLAVLVGCMVAAVPAKACDGVHNRWCGKRHSVNYNKRAIRHVARVHRRLSEADTKRLLWLARKESTYRNWATNGSCKGLFQLMTKQPKSKWANPKWNTNRAITYIFDRYGSVANAVAHSQRYGWY